MQALHGAATMLRQRGSDASCAYHQAQALLYYELQRQSAMLAFIDVFWILGIMCLCMIPLMFFVKSAPREGAALPGH